MEKGPREMNRAGRTVYPILLMVCATHLLNDMMQSVIPAVYPLLKEKFGFTFAQRVFGGVIYWQEEKD